jgi:hypothetical protein
VVVNEFEGKSSSGLCDLAALDAVGANVHPSRSTLRHLNANALQVGIEFPRRTIICVRHVIAKLRTFATDFAAFSHFNETLQGVELSILQWRLGLRFTNH